MYIFPYKKVPYIYYFQYRLKLKPQLSLHRSYLHLTVSYLKSRIFWNACMMVSISSLNLSKVMSAASTTRWQHLDNPVAGTSASNILSNDGGVVTKMWHPFNSATSFRFSLSRS